MRIPRMIVFGVAVTLWATGCTEPSNESAGDSDSDSSRSAQSYPITLDSDSTSTADSATAAATDTPPVRSPARTEPRLGPMEDYGSKSLAEATLAAYALTAGQTPTCDGSGSKVRWHCTTPNSISPEGFVKWTVHITPTGKKNYVTPGWTDAPNQTAFNFAQGDYSAGASAGGGYGGDVDCDDISGSVGVGSSDPNRLDADGDGVGCEWNDGSSGGYTGGGTDSIADGGSYVNTCGATRDGDGDGIWCE